MVFTRGGTQSLVVATLGTAADEQLIDGLQEENIFKKFMFHYNFPPFSTGEARYLRAPGRREIGHGSSLSCPIMIPSPIPFDLSQIFWNPMAPLLWLQFAEEVFA